MATDLEAQTAEDTLAHSLHSGCFACGGDDGLGLVFHGVGPDAVSAEWCCEAKYQSYKGIIHGGIIATVLDSAMTNCLLMKGIPALTADMKLKYREPVPVGAVVTVNAALVRSRSSVFVLEAHIVNQGRISATASARFINAALPSAKRHV